jgi:hypothetical protein
LRTIEELGFAAQPFDVFGVAANARHRQLKRAAINAYQSQLRAFGPGGEAGLYSSERYWRLRETDAQSNARPRPQSHNALWTPSPNR